MRTNIARNIRAVVSSSIALAAAIVLTAAPAAAQEHSTGAVRPAPMLVSAREVAKYRIIGVRGEGLPAEVTIADSAGQLTANYRLPGQRVAEPMMVTVMDQDIVLQAETDKGVLTLQLYGVNDQPVGGAVTGRWILAGRSGELRGRAQ